ncbi:EscV/YscV/HrcV family type III secretion system export apparatus protein [Shewanella surugensis]|uniref:EscV/YscV/HrcV family type III secretion system export apparatus protein n=1 Tax=Shewanella surugensis TaxID=212020 RepID=A0ABT0L7M1_9GAMM|nr:EscV/YscV/HrcV family type III secretion system export apparatus protein [Shewanella surugensis]MCL1123683.1 EscV/YscV/HrcV family type III secretion system export apparatus protein [Shewanella surugensis]
MKTLTRWLQIAAGRQDIILGAMLMVAVFMMILPLPTLLIDVLIAFNLALSIMLLMIAIYIKDPLEFSVFPSLLLITTLFRLALTISTSRLILLQADAGHIVYAFGNFVVGGNLAVGIIIFAIITIVQFIVITKGSERVAEVGARFSLDAMPGKQMSIDGDMRAGVIDAKEAKRQRGLVQKESQLYGAMDGAMKFVKGDAIAGVIVILANIIGGISIGVMQQDMSASDALNLYAILSVGDGLIAQIPALLISITAGLIVTRVPGELRQNLASDLVHQMGRQPASLMLASGVMFVFALIPGFPFLVFGTIGGLIGFGGWYAAKKHKKDSASGENMSHGGEVNAEGEVNMDNMSPSAVPLMLTLGRNVDSEGVKDELQRLRWQLFERLGLPLPDIQFQRIKGGQADECQVLLYQEPVLQITLNPEEVLLNETVASLPARKEMLSFSGETLHWIQGNVVEQAQAGQMNLCEGAQIPCFLVGKVVERYANELIGVQETRYLMDAMEERYGELVKELQRLLSVSKIAECLQRLVEEGISIRDLRTIFETLVTWVPKEKDIVMLTEYVRIALRRHIRRRFTGPQGWISVIMIGEGIENTIREGIRQSTAGSYSALDASQTQLILHTIKAKLNDNVMCVLLTSLDVRRYLRKIVERDLFTYHVLSFQELGDDAEIKVIAHVDFVGDELDAIA